MRAVKRPIEVEYYPLMSAYIEDIKHLGGDCVEIWTEAKDTESERLVCSIRQFQYNAQVAFEGDVIFKDTNGEIKSMPADKFHYYYQDTFRFI